MYDTLTSCGKTLAIFTQESTYSPEISMLRIRVHTEPTGRTQSGSSEWNYFCSELIFPEPVLSALDPGGLHCLGLQPSHQKQKKKYRCSTFCFCAFDILNMWYVKTQFCSKNLLLVPQTKCPNATNASLSFKTSSRSHVYERSRVVCTNVQRQHFIQMIRQFI